MFKPYYNTDITFFAETNFRDQRKKFGIKHKDRRKHIYIIGKTGMGKTSLLEHMIAQDICAGRGIAVFDSLGRLVERILHYIPESRVRDVVYLNPSDIDYPFAFNILSLIRDFKNPDEHLFGLMTILKEMWQDVWDSHLEYVLKNLLLTLILADPHSTILGLLPLLTNQTLREQMISKIQDKALVNFWTSEFSGSERFLETSAVLQAKIGSLISNKLLCNIIGQSKNTFSADDIIKNKKIVLVVLNNQEIGVDAQKLLGCSIGLSLFLTAKKLADVNNDFYVYMDEFDHYSASFCKEYINTSNCGFNMILTNQYLDQIDEDLKKAILENIGTILAFRVGEPTAEILSAEFYPYISKECLMQIKEYGIVVRLYIDGTASKPFLAQTLLPLPIVGLKDKITDYSREFYTRTKKEAESEVDKSLFNFVSAPLSVNISLNQLPDAAKIQSPVSYKELAKDQVAEFD